MEKGGGQNSGIMRNSRKLLEVRIMFDLMGLDQVYANVKTLNCTLQKRVQTL